MRSHHYLIFSLLIALQLWTCGSDQKRKTISQDIPAAVYPCLQSGDLILRAGQGLLSSTLMMGLDEPRAFSHVGILYQNGEDWEVWHSVSSDYGDKDGLQTARLLDWLAEARENAYLISRHVSGENLVFLQAAKALLDAEIAFDDRFDFADSTRMYCTEFVYHALRDAGLEAPTPELLNSGVVGVDFEPFWGGDLFEVIYDPAN
ncbi:MAG: YiiX/YebB-like N1pC/P60 family cysteine hydrolase [Bacteroidota bacterium]